LSAVKKEEYLMVKTTRSSNLKAFGVALLLFALFGADSTMAAKDCLGCHGDKAVAQTILYRSHGQAADERLADGSALCQECHGESLEHTTKPTKVSPDILFGKDSDDVGELVAVCTGCHSGGHQKTWAMSEHAAGNVACNDCHNVHAVVDFVQDRKSQTDVCLNCHVEQKTGLWSYSRHPMREGIVACSDCHNTHGGKGPSMLKEFTVNETCYQCHTEKRGPFLWEHEPVQDDCTNCHAPHGSVNDNLLTLRQPVLCQQCHHSTSHRGLNHLRDERYRTLDYNYGKACLNCHGAIHGTNHASGGGYFE
jgi:DmsE family decaheme c-type cytochrome